MKPRFQKRHYEAVAAVMSSVAREFYGNRLPVWEKTKTKLGDHFINDNPSFDRGRFEEACEP